MDSITQLTVGAVSGYLIAGKPLGRKAVLYGALLGTLPDLDILLPLVDSNIDRLTSHRGYSHAWLPQLLATPFISTLLWYIHHRKYKNMWLPWTLLVFIALFTHALVDLFNVYGTQIALPVTNYNFEIGNLFIIDPFFTLPLLLAMILAIIKPEKNYLPIHKFVLFSLIYALTSVGMSISYQNKARQIMSSNQIFYDQVQAHVVGPSILLWRVLAVNEDHWYESTFSTLKPNKIEPVKSYSRNIQWLPIANKHPQWNDLIWFNKNNFMLEKIGNSLYLNDLRFGVGKNLVFVWKLAEQQADGLWQYSTLAIRERREVSGELWNEYLKQIFD